MKKYIIICSSDSNDEPNRKTDIICDLDIEDHLSANMRAAEESRVILGADYDYAGKAYLRKGYCERMRRS